jgi:hypothetical protein
MLRNQDEKIKEQYCSVTVGDPCWVTVMAVQKIKASSKPEQNEYETFWKESSRRKSIKQHRRNENMIHYQYVGARNSLCGGLFSNRN